jgi:hypothetical protein
MNSEIVILPAMFFMFGFVVYVIADVFRRRAQARMVAEFHTKLLEKIGSARDFAEFFASDAGKRFIESLSTDSGTPQMRILRSLQTGLVLMALGIGLFILTDQRNFSIEAADGLTVTATVTTAIGIGLMVSTVISYLLSWQMGLLTRREPPRQLESNRTTT